MKKLFYSVLCVTAAAVLLSGCAGNKLSDDFDKDEVVEEASEMVEVINTMDYEKIVGEMREDLRDQITSEQLKEAWGEKLSGLGKFSKITSEGVIGDKSKETKEDYAVAVLACEYENGTATFTLVYDTELELVGLYMK
ncbi:MAG: DUF3887 domain-containing protein [Oscillospiraceae bacterium]